MQLRPDSRLLQALVSANLWESFYVVDVGASGGIASAWAAFGDSLRAIGFEPLVAEVDRLNREEPRPRVRYEAAFVSSPNYDRLFPPELRGDPIHSRNNDVFGRSSAVRATEKMSMDYVRDVFNRGEAKTVTDRHISLDEYIPAAEYGLVDFIKVDTDGHDFEVLLGAEQLLRQGVLGLLVEAQLHGAAHDYSNTFANIDRYLRGLGFTLFDLVTYRYSRGALPLPFVYDIPAQTHEGQVLWGDAVYLRDLGDPSYERKHEFEITRERVAKLAALFSLFALPDCAVELIEVRAATLGGDVIEWLNLAARDAGITDADYRTHLAAFDRDPRTFYPSARRALAREEQRGAQESERERQAVIDAHAARVAAVQAENERLKERLRELKTKNAALRQKLRDRTSSAG
jgi:FkbM family methyltransferase